MPYGFVAVIDLLGYKEESKKRSPEDMISLLENLRNIATKAAGENIQKVAVGVDTGEGDTMTYLRIPTDIETAFISDTFVAACKLDPFPTSLHLSYGAILRFTSTLQVMAGSLMLPVRGCITVGDYYIKSNMIAGAGVYEAYSMAELSEEAIVHISPRAMYSLEELDNQNIESHHGVIELFKAVFPEREATFPEPPVTHYPLYELHLKTSQINLPVINPFKSFVSFDEDRSELLDTFEKNVYEKMKQPELHLYSKFDRTRNLYRKLKEEAGRQREYDAVMFPLMMDIEEKLGMNR